MPVENTLFYDILTINFFLRRLQLLYKKARQDAIGAAMGKVE